MQGIVDPEWLYMEDNCHIATNVMIVLGFLLFIIACKYRKWARFAIYIALGMMLIRGFTPFCDNNIEFRVTLEAICVLIFLGCDIKANIIAVMITSFFVILIAPEFVYLLFQDN